MSVPELMRRTRLFIVSYAPLTAILAVRSFPIDTGDLWPPIGSSWTLLWAAICVLGIVDAFRLPATTRHQTTLSVTLTDVTDQGSAVAGYLATYILPLLTATSDGWRDLFVMVIYLVVLFVVFIRSDLSLVNPTLYLSGWQVLEATHVTSEAERRVMVLYPSRAGRVARTLTVRAASLGAFLVAQPDRRRIET